ncbi:MAG: hypothetical protein RSA70_01660 [Clostridia bacterium]
MLYNKEITACCAYCAHAVEINHDQSACKRHGVVAKNYHCGRYEYDPTRRVPPESVDVADALFSERDFSIDSTER